MPVRRRWLVAIPVAAVVLVVAGTWVFIHFVEGPAPKRLAFDPAPSAPSTPAAGATAGATGTGPAGLDGTWKPTKASQAGYRVKEILFGQSTTAVGRTNAVTGQLAIAGTKVTDASFTVDMTQVRSDQSRRDGQFRGRIMETDQFPTSTFKLASPVDLGTIPGDQQPASYTVTGDLTLHGTTRPVTFKLDARRNGATIEVNGTIPITFADWKIPNPSLGPADTEDHGELEFLLVFAR